jgi:hypothetical protein
MAKQITCECGTVLSGETADQVVAAATAHIREDHPDLVGKVSDDDLRGWIEEV